MVSLEDIENTILADTKSGESVLATFHEILEVIRFPQSGQNTNYPIHRLDSILQLLAQLLPITEAFDHRGTDVWARWMSTIPKVRNNLQSISADSALTVPENVFLSGRSLLTCLIAIAIKKVHSGLVPAKVVLLIGHHLKYLESKKYQRRWDYRNSDNEILATAIQSCYTVKTSVYRAIANEYFPEWPTPSPTMWEEMFLEKARNAPSPRTPSYYGNIYIPDRHAFIRKMHNILREVSKKHSHSSLPRQENLPPGQQEPTKPPPQKQGGAVVKQPPSDQYSRSRRKQPARPSFNLFQRQAPQADANTEGLAPATLHVVPQQDTLADQPIQMAAVQSLEVRYTNYRTAMDNQRLPWSWDCLNQFEIVALRDALKAHTDLDNPTLAEKQGAFLVWLLMVTGQSIDQILQLGLAHSPNNQSALMFGPTYRRHIHSPPHPFQPNEQQNIFLSSHADFADLPLTPPFPSLVSELGLDDPKVELFNRHQNVGAYLNLDDQSAEKIARQFLEQHRTRDIRLLPGKIRNVLGTEIMRVSGDPVITHLLTALPTDMPPSGIYYTSYSEEVLQRVYKKAITQIFGEWP